MTASKIKALGRKKHSIPSPNPEFMQRAIALSRKASIEEKSGGVFGAVIVKDGKIIAEGYNQVISQKDPTWHAEMQAIREACKKLGSPHLEGCVMYTSAECCPMCLATAYWAHLDHIFYGATYEDSTKYGNFDDADILSDCAQNPKSGGFKVQYLCVRKLWKFGKNSLEWQTGFIINLNFRFLLPRDSNH